jgi:hypothetical protein
MHDIQVSVTSPEAADHGVAEFWSGREQSASPCWRTVT